MWPFMHFQTEEHVLLNCKLTEPLRSKSSIIGTRYRNITDLPNFRDPHHSREIAVYCAKVLELFK